MTRAQAKHLRRAVVQPVEGLTYDRAWRCLVRDGLAVVTGRGRSQYRVIYAATDAGRERALLGTDMPA